jgi:lipopolysaccharide exporter
MSHSGLTNATVKGSIWNYANFAFGKGVIFLTTVILARMLQPQDFGLMAMALVVINFLKKIQNLGVGDAFIYYQDQTNTFANTAFLISTVTGLFFSTLIFFSARGVASFYQEPGAIPVIQALSVWFIIINLGATHEAVLKKEMDFHKRFFPQITQSVVKGGCSIILAATGFGVWSLVWGQLSGEVASTVLFWVACQWRPQIQFSLDAAKTLIHYGSQTILMKFLQGVFRNVDYLIIGHRMDTAQLGFYTIAFRMPDIVIEGIQSAVTPVIFSAYSKVQNDIHVLKRGFLKTLKFVSIFCIPISLGMYIIAPEFVEVFYTNRWAPVVPVTRVLSIYAIINAFDSQASIIYRATDRISIANKIGIIKMISAIPVLWFAAGYSIFAVAIAQVFLALFIAVIQVITITSILEIRYTDLIKSLFPSITSAIVMIMGVWIMKIFITPLPAIVRLIILIAVSGMLFSGAMRVMHPEVFRQLKDILKKREEAL